jgi:hypothetical protein
MNRAVVEHVRAIQTSVVEAGQSCFLESELGHLRTLVRLTVEFLHYLQGEDPAPGIEDKLGYVCESVFSGMDSFGLVRAAYQALPGARITVLDSAVGSSIESLKAEFLSLYREFSVESNFEIRCRLLLDLFKLQIVFAGLSY